MQSSRCANGSCPRRGRITCQALPVCLSVSYLSLLDTSSYPQIPSHVVRKSLHVEYTLFSAAHPPDFPRSPRPAWAGFRPQARATSVHDSMEPLYTPRSPRCATCCAVPKSVEQSSRFHLLRNRRPDLPTAFSLSPQSLDIVLGLSGWQKSRLSALIRLSSTGSRYRRTTTLPSVFPPWFSCSQHAARRSVSAVWAASPLVSASTLTSGLLCSLQAVWLPDLSPSIDRCPTASHIAVVAVSTSFSQ